MNLVTEVKVYEMAGETYKVVIKHNGRTHEGSGVNPTQAYKWAENQFVVKPGLVVGE